MIWFRKSFFFSYGYHHSRASTSIASQSSLDIIPEYSPTECHPLNHPRHPLKNRNDYETISDDVFTDVNCEGDETCDERQKSTAKSAQGWRNVRAVMAYYYTLRKIKRHDFHNCHKNIHFQRFLFKFWFSFQCFGSMFYLPFILLHRNTFFWNYNFVCVSYSERT